MTLTLWELRSSVRDEMMIDKNWRIWTDRVVDEKINEAISKLVSDVAHIQKYFEIELKDSKQRTLEFFEIHKPCIVCFASYLLFSMPSDSRNMEKANFKMQKYIENLKILLNKICKK